MTKKRCLFALMMLVMLFSCKSTPETPDRTPDNAAVENPEDNPGNAGSGYQVSEEEYKETLEYINSFISAVNTAIKDKDFEQWKTFLSQKYIDAYDSPEDLAEYSEMFKKKGYDVRLVNLKDYFDYVVVASRQNLEISHLEFIDATHLKVMTLYRNEPAVMYYMEIIDGEWKISVWQSRQS